MCEREREYVLMSLCTERYVGTFVCVCVRERVRVDFSFVINVEKEMCELSALSCEKAFENVASDGISCRSY